LLQFFLRDKQEPEGSYALLVKHTDSKLVTFVVLAEALKPYAFGSDNRDINFKVKGTSRCTLHPPANNYVYSDWRRRRVAGLVASKASFISVQ
jgi:hypothetical protein